MKKEEKNLVPKLKPDSRGTILVSVTLNSYAKTRGSSLRAVCMTTTSSDFGALLPDWLIVRAPFALRCRVRDVQIIIRWTSFDDESIAISFPLFFSSFLNLIDLLRCTELLHITMSFASFYCPFIKT